MEKINSIREALIFLVRGLYDAELKLLGLMPEFIERVQTPGVKSMLTEQLHHLRVKLPLRYELFRALGETPAGLENKIIHDLLNDTSRRLHDTPKSSISDTQLIRSLQNINENKFRNYLTCFHFSGELGELNASAILREILDSENTARMELLRTEREVNINPGVEPVGLLIKPT